MPLAIELAAAWVKLLPVRALLARLSDKLALLTDGPRDLPARQQTLRGAISWSYDLLDAGERALFARLGAFVGGWSVEAAAAVASELRIENEELRNGQSAKQFSILEGLASLADKSLLRRGAGVDGEPRFTMLESIREYARERLAQAGEDEIVGRLHAGYFLELAERIEPSLGGPQQGSLLELLEQEHDNLRAALSWALEHDAEQGLRLSVALWWFWFVRGYLSEGRRWLEAALAKSDSALKLLRAKALNGAGVLAHDQGDYARSTALHEESLKLARELGRSGGVAASLNNLGLVARSQGDYERAAAYYAESLALRRAEGDDWSAAIALSNLGVVARDQGDYERAVAFYEESLALRRKLGDNRGLAMLLNNLGLVVAYQGDYGRAGVLHEQSLALQRELGDRAGISDSLHGLGRVRYAQGDYAQSQRFYGESLQLRQELGDQAGIAACLEGLAAVAGARGRPQQAARLLGAAQALRDSIGSPRPPIEQPGYDRTVAAVRAALGESAYAIAWVEGQAMSLAQVVAFALG
jgi:tetratricopeptide (TPR) repeat protein